MTCKSLGIPEHISAGTLRPRPPLTPPRSVNLGTGENGMHPDFKVILAYLRTRTFWTPRRSNRHGRFPTPAGLPSSATHAMVVVPDVDISRALLKPDPYCPIIRGERRSLAVRMAATRDLPKLSSSCTTVVIAR